MPNLLKIFLVFAIFYNPSNLFSHGGGLNSKGCHNNKKIGDYHCHKRKQNTYKEKPHHEKKKNSYNDKYKRKSFQYKSYPPNTNIGFYTLSRCDTNIDHVVSLKDAYDSGASSWNNSLKKKFANDKINHVASCLRVNSSKGASTPVDFLRKSNDGKGMEYRIKSFCAYLDIYYRVKTKYSLSFNNNNPELFFKCGISIK
tara:strand:+ start:213 stop:809 length:597 start_codon:yes stop_codon:yes gene_type:complete